MSRLSNLVRRWTGTKRPEPVSRHPSLRECHERTRSGYEAARLALLERPEMRELQARGKFSVDWGADLRIALEMICAAERKRIRAVLEIGALEGRLTVFCASYFPSARGSIRSTHSPAATNMVRIASRPWSRHSI